MKGAAMQLDFEDIKKLIPQRFPFIMIDKVVEVDPGKKAETLKNISGNDIFFLGHFPDKAIMPGVAIIEAMAQTAIILFAAGKEETMNNQVFPWIREGEISSSRCSGRLPEDQGSECEIAAERRVCICRGIC